MQREGLEQLELEQLKLSLSAKSATTNKLAPKTQEAVSHFAITEPK